MLKVSDNKLEKNLELVTRVSNDVISDRYVRYFDNDGFELSFLEQEFYRENKVPLSSILNHACDQREWIVGGDEHFKLDHSMLLHRWCFTGEARKQLEARKKDFPQLNKYLGILPKWGLDFALEYYDKNDWLEVLHIETDYRSYEEAQEAKIELENLIISTDWENFVKSLIANKSKWEYLVGFQQNDWKAAHWGLNKAEHTLKAFV